MGVSTQESLALHLSDVESDDALRTRIVESALQQEAAIKSDLLKVLGDVGIYQAVLDGICSAAASGHPSYCYGALYPTNDRELLDLATSLKTTGQQRVFDFFRLCHVMYSENGLPWPPLVDNLDVDESLYPNQRVVFPRNQTRDFSANLTRCNDVLSAAMERIDQGLLSRIAEFDKSTPLTVPLYSVAIVQGAV